MVPAPETFQKSLSQNKIRKVKSSFAALKEIKKCRRASQMYVNRLPYKHLVKEFAADLKEICDEGEPINKMLQEASQAYLAGVFDGYSNVCQNVAQKESTNFMLCLASLGLKKLVSTMASDRNLSEAAKRSVHHFHRNSELIPGLIEESHDHEHEHDDQNEHHHQHHHHHHHNHNPNNNERQSQHVDNVIQNIMRRISSNVTISVLRE